MSEKIAFVQECLDRKKRIVDVCAEFGISEKTGHKQLQRFKESGVDGLRDRSHAVLNHPFRVAPEVIERIIALRRKYPLYGPQMLRDWLVQNEPQVRWPAASSIGEIIKRAGLVYRRRRRNRTAERAALDTGRERAIEPNLVWTADFKGQFRLRQGLGPYCYPLTVMDLHSRFVLGISALETTSVDSTRVAFVRMFREYGLPSVIRTDNGVPFANPSGLGRLGRLAFWWVRLGIKPEHIKPATPSENGAHERFHRTLKAAATKPASASFKAQQDRFDEFRTEYNTSRPHSSLPEHKPPSHFYLPSKREYPERPPAVIYPESSEVRLVGTNGCIYWRKSTISLSTILSGEYVAVSEDEDRFAVSYGALQLGHIDAETTDFTPEVRWAGST